MVLFLLSVPESGNVLIDYISDGDQIHPCFVLHVSHVPNPGADINVITKYGKYFTGIDNKRNYKQKIAVQPVVNQNNATSNKMMLQPPL